MRLSTVNPHTLDTEQQAVFDAIVNGSRKEVPDPLAIWLHHPKLAHLAQSLGEYCRYDSCLEPRLSELAILMMGKYWQAEYEWAVHKPFALQAGLNPAVIEAIRLGETPNFDHADERAIYEFMQALHQDKQVDDSTYQAIHELLGAGAVLDLVAIAGYYTLISMTIKVFEVPPVKGIAPELP